MSRGSSGGNNPVIIGALTFLSAGLNALIDGKSEHALGDANASYGAISSSTDNWVRANFTPAFGYIFQDAVTVPVNAMPGSKVVSFDDMLVWDKQKFTDSADIGLWIQQQLLQSLPTDVIAPLAVNLTSLISTVFQIVDNSWEHLSKSYTIPFSNGTKNMAFDVLMVYSCATSSDGSDTVGICRLCAVAYETHGWKKE
ncbi:hypothetical protein V476_25175 [Pseudomonas syringae KCTC 12500]|uniref:hypothetical protein n=1 Tax=Pseudomonas syringae group TaxID=136849 RepID=UPI00046B0098|nr:MULTISPECIES: hypothetical protein [Pseudomonas syringae group]KMY04232.1 hypothetical protein V476_25175 [Pseudomonas syringae KCTC 12500]POR87543.1 hypothetical protein BKM21_02610 [Pseudomonas syringae pv. syringae]